MDRPDIGRPSRDLTGNASKSPAGRRLSVFA